MTRILAIANIHRRLYTSHDVRFVELDAYMRSLGEEIDAAMNTGGPRHTIIVDAEAGIRLPTDMAISLGVVLTELVTNAVKYAYPAGITGDVRLFLRRLEGGRIRISVEDDGIGWQGAGAPQGSGLGSRIIRAIGKSLGATLSYDPAHPGTRAGVAALVVQFVCLDKIVAQAKLTVAARVDLKLRADGGAIGEVDRRCNHRGVTPELQRKDFTFASVLKFFWIVERHCSVGRINLHNEPAEETRAEYPIAPATTLCFGRQDSHAPR